MRATEDHDRAPSEDDGLVESAPPKGDGLAQPERRMLLAILEDALDQLLAFGLAEPPAQRSEPERWLFSNDRKAPFSFINVSETLALDPRWIREKLVTEIERRRGGARSARRSTPSA